MKILTTMTMTTISYSYLIDGNSLWDGAPIKRICVGEAAPVSVVLTKTVAILILATLGVFIQCCWPMDFGF